MNMQKIECKCGKHLGSIDLDSTTQQKTNGTCSHCSRRYSIIYGNGEFKVIYPEEISKKKLEKALEEIDDILEMVNDSQIEADEYWRNFEKEAILK